MSNGGSAIFQKRGVIESTWEGGALDGVRGRKEDRPAGSTTACSQPGSLIISMTTTRKEVAPVQGFHHPEENPGGVILLSTEGLGAKWRKE